MQFVHTTMPQISEGAGNWHADCRIVHWSCCQGIECTVPVKSLDSPTHSMVFLYFYYFLHSKIMEKTSKLLKNTWNHVVTTSVKSKYIFYSSKVATLAFSQTASPGILFQQSCRRSHICWELVGRFPFTSAIQLIPNHLDLVEVGGLCRPGHLMQHSITLLLGKIALTQPGGVLGHCPVEKQMTVGLSPNQMGWHIAAEWCGSDAG